MTKPIDMNHTVHFRMFFTQRPG